MICELVTPCSRPLPDISGHFCVYVKLVLKKYLRLSLDIFVDVRNIATLSHVLEIIACGIGCTSLE
jgi:hypothetical protein